MFSSKSIKFRLIFSFLVVAMLFMGTLFYSIRSQMSMSVAQNIGVDKFKTSAKLFEVIKHIEAVYSVIGDSVINHDMEDTYKSLKELYANQEEDFKILVEVAETDEEKKLVTEIKESYTQYLAMFEKDFLPEVKNTTEVTAKAKSIDEKMDNLRNVSIDKVNKILSILTAKALEADDLFDVTAKSSILYSLIGVGVCLLLALIFAFSFSNSITIQLQSVTSSVSGVALKLKESAESLSEMTMELSEANSQQAAAIQETSATMEEITSMIDKSSKSAELSAIKANESAASANKGEEASIKMMTSMTEIKESHHKISMQVSDSNKRIGEIVKVINDIGSKTKVINDIVFQTKLLSFNASVEAARAGEHGKGFAVVAEEVGNLARMSGLAAKEIGDMLDYSIRTVEQAISDSQTKISEIIVAGEHVVDNGVDVAREASQHLQEINRGISLVNSNSQDIALATHEQAQGAAQIATALGELDKATNQNATVSKQVSSSAEEVNLFSQQLTSNMDQLKDLIYGKAS